MSIEWFRSWHGAPTDPKWRTVARRAGARPGDVAAVAWVLFDRASQADDRGSIDGYDAEVIADALGYEPDEIERIIAAMVDKGVIIGGRLAAWEKHQPKREREQDDSAARVTAHRARKSHVTPCNASDDQETPRVEEIREEVATQPVASRKIEIDKLEAELREAAGQENNPAPSLLDLSPIASLLKAGYDLREDVLPKLRAARASGKRPSTWSYYVNAITEGKARNDAIPGKATSPPASVTTVWVTDDDPRWPDLVARHQAEKGKLLRPSGSRFRPGQGADIPTDWLEPRAH